jgi:hypothetical protein
VICGTKCSVVEVRQRVVGFLAFLFICNTKVSMILQTGDYQNGLEEDIIHARFKMNNSACSSAITVNIIAGDPLSSGSVR